MKRFAMLGAAGFVAPRHLKTIHQTGNRLTAACDPYDGVGILDRFSQNVASLLSLSASIGTLRSFAEKEPESAVDYLSIMLPELPARRTLPSGVKTSCVRDFAKNRWLSVPGTWTNLSKSKRNMGEKSIRCFNSDSIQRHKG